MTFLLVTPAGTSINLTSRTNGMTTHNTQHTHSYAGELHQTADTFNISTCPLHTIISRCGKERRILIGSW